MTEKVLSREEAPKRPTLGLWLAAIPALLILSICIALYLGATAKHETPAPQAGEVTAAGLADSVAKLTRLVGPRDLETPEGRQALKSAVAMAEGTLGTSNTGYETFQTTDPAVGLLWRTLWVDTGKTAESKTDQVLLLTANYGGRGEETAFLIALGEFFTRNKPALTARTVFHPPLPGSDQTSWLRERVMADDEEFAGRVEIVAGSESTQWATLSCPPKLAEALRGILKARRWDQAVNLIELAGLDHVQLTVHRHPVQPVEGTANFMVRLLPVVRSVLDLLGDQEEA